MTLCWGRTYALHGLPARGRRPRQSVGTGRHRGGAGVRRGNGGPRGAAIAQRLGPELAVFPSHHAGFLGWRVRHEGRSGRIRRSTSPGAPDSLSSNMTKFNWETSVRGSASAAFEPRTSPWPHVGAQRDRNCQAPQAFAEIVTAAAALSCCQLTSRTLARHEGARSRLANSFQA